MRTRTHTQTYVDICSSVQDLVVSGDDCLPGTHVHILLVLRNCCHGDRRHDLQVHWVSWVCCHGDVLLPHDCAFTDRCVNLSVSYFSSISRVARTVHIWINTMYLIYSVCVFVCASEQRRSGAMGSVVYHSALPVMLCWGWKRDHHTPKTGGTQNVAQTSAHARSERSALVAWCSVWTYLL